MTSLINEPLMKKTAAQTILLAAVPGYFLVLYEVYGRLSRIPSLLTVSSAIPWLLTAAVGILLAVAFFMIVAKPALKIIARNAALLRQRTHTNP